MTPRSPLVHRIAIVVGAVVLTALVSMATTLAVSKSIEGNATAINLAGALRMGAFQLLSRIATPSAEQPGQDGIATMLDRYQERLTAPAIQAAVPQGRDHPLALQYQTILNAWNTGLRPALEGHDQGAPIRGEMLAATRAYVEDVDRLVGMLEQRTEARIDLLHLIQIISLVFSILIIVALFIDLRNRILRPLRKLVGIATAVGEQDFSRKANLAGSDELAQLGQAFDQMTSELALTYHEL
ncbi:MAG: HAMP domain-containing protein, partial [Pseudomonadota bacterium]|nr:HAMP domain-containing protein [Pseudomonadota bacterium]